MVLAQTFVALPFLVLAVEGALRASDRRYEEAAATLGARPLTVFRRVTLPLVGPGSPPARCWPGRARWASSAPRSPSPATSRAPPRPCRCEVYLALETDPDAAMLLSVLLLAVSVAVLVLLRDRWVTRW